MAEALAKHKGDALSLDAITHLDVAVAEALARYKGMIELGGLR